MLKRYLGAALMAVALVVVPAVAVQGAQPPAQEGFVPVDQLEGQEQMPAAPLVAAAYGVAWAAVLIYLFSIWRRLAVVEREIAEVSRRVEVRGRT